MSVALEFSKNSHNYENYNVIQKSVRDVVMNNFQFTPQRVADLGCGSGALYKSINWEVQKFIAIDFSEGMLNLHPQARNIELHLGDFNRSEIFSYLQSQNIEHLFSLSALQWAEDIGDVFENIAKLECDFSLAIFTSNTFKTLHKTADLEAILRSASEVEYLARKYLKVRSCDIKEYKLHFDTTREMFRYIKKSGVSGSRKSMSVTKMKKLMREYPLEYLEFEVIFLSSY